MLELLIALIITLTFLIIQVLVEKAIAPEFIESCSQPQLVILRQLIDSNKIKLKLFVFLYTQIKPLG